MNTGNTSTRGAEKRFPLGQGYCATDNPGIAGNARTTCTARQPRLLQTGRTCRDYSEDTQIRA